MEEIKKGNCDTCGFLVMRAWSDTVLHEATQDYREKGRDEGSSLSRPPLCFALAARLDREVEEHTRERAGPNMSNAEQDLLAVIQRTDRNCSKWRKWEMGFSPKEHREMMDREWMLKWQADREEADRKWREKQRQEDKQWRRIELIVIGIIGVLVAGGFAVLGAFIQRGSIP